MSEPRKRSWLRRYRWLVLSVAMVACYLLGGFVGVPLIARHLVLPRINDRLNGQIVVEQIDCNPIRMNLRLAGVEVRDASSRSIAGFGSFVGDLKFWATIFREGIHFQRVEVFDWHGRAIIDEQGHVDLASLFKPAIASSEPRKPLKALPRLVVDRLGAERGRLSLIDRAWGEPFEMNLLDIHVRADHFDSEPTHDNHFTIMAETAQDDRLAGAGTVRFDPLSVLLSADASGFDLSRFQPYLSVALSSRLASGVSAARLTVDIAPLAEPYRATIGLDDVRVENIDLTLEGQPLARVAQSTIASVRADLLQRVLMVGPVELRGVVVQVERLADGGWSVRDLLKPIELTVGVERDDSLLDLIERLVNALKAIVASAIGPWELNAEGVTLSDTTVTFVDRTPATPVTIELADLTLRAGPATSREGFDAPVELFTKLGSGELRLAGRVRAEPMRAELEVEASSIEVASLSAYVPLTFSAPLPENATVASGLADAKGRLEVDINGPVVDAGWSGRVALKQLVVEPLARVDELSATGDARLMLAPDQPVRASYAGDVEGTQIRAAIPDLYAIDATLGGVSIAGLRVELPIESVEAASIAIRAPVLSLEYPVVSAPIDESPDLARTFTIELPLTLRLGEAQITEGRATLVDPGASPRVEAVVDELMLKVAPIDTTLSSTSTLALSGRVQSTGRFEMNGTLDPLRLLRQTDARLMLESVPMKPFEAASGRYLGYLVESGRLGLTFPFRIDEGSLDGQLQLNLDRFYLGTRVESPDALDLPIKLGLDLLRDPREQIDINLRITGDLNDPRFSILRLAWQAVGNLMSKAVTAPFQLLASAFGAGDRDISQVTFNPGAHELTPDAIATLDVVARALTQRPRLTLVLKPGVVDADIRALRLAALRSELFEEARQIDPNLQQLDDVTLAAMVQARYQAIIPPTPDTPAASDDEMLDAMLASIEIRPEWVDALRQSRVQAVIDLIVTNGGIDAARIAVEPMENAEGPRVVFDLR